MGAEFLYRIEHGGAIVIFFPMRNLVAGKINDAYGGDFSGLAVKNDFILAFDEKSTAKDTYFKNMKFHTLVGALGTLDAFVEVFTTDTGREHDGMQNSLLGHEICAGAPILGFPGVFHLRENTDFHFIADLVGVHETPFISG